VNLQIITWLEEHNVALAASNTSVVVKQA